MIKYIKMVLCIAAFIFLYFIGGDWITGQDFIAGNPYFLMLAKFLVCALYGVLFGLILMNFVGGRIGGRERLIVGIVLLFFGLGELISYAVTRWLPFDIVHQISVYLTGGAVCFQIAFGIWIVFAILSMIRRERA